MFHKFPRFLTGALALMLAAAHAAAAEPFLESGPIFPAEHWHNHSACVVELPNGDLLVCWFHGSGERKEDDVLILGARKAKGSKEWSAPFVMADTPGFPDTNCTMFVDRRKRLWLIWPTILANLWETALLKVKISDNPAGAAAPTWNVSEVLHIKPGEEFERKSLEWVAASRRELGQFPEALRAKISEHLDNVERMAGDKLAKRLGWMTRAHPTILSTGRIILPLYSDGFSYSLMAYSDDEGESWKTSEPLPGPGNVQPSVVERKDGSLLALMRDNGLPPKRLLRSDSKDGGVTWSPVVDSDIPNPGSGAEVILLQSGHWLLISNDVEEGRGRLTLMMSDDEGETWKWRRVLEEDPSGSARYHYPTLAQAADGSIHAVYSHHIEESAAPKDSDGKPMAKTIKHAHFNEEWIQVKP